MLCLFQKKISNMAFESAKACIYLIISNQFVARNERCCVDVTIRCKLYIACKQIENSKQKLTNDNAL
jgi:hypothetical protein